MNNSIRTEWKKIYLAFVGEKHCTTGKPHPITGRMSKYGTIKIFKSRKKRDEFCNQYNYAYNMYPIPCNRKTAKTQFCAGDTQKQFDEYLLMIEYSDSEIRHD